jgi:predicted nucleotidyltransferase component of viral defense system
MANPNTPNAAASVKARLLNLSRQKNRPFQELLQYYGMERFLFRLGRSRYSDRFVLKGALLLHVWDVQDSRATRDIDLLALEDNSPDHFTKCIIEVCHVDADCSDGIVYAADSVMSEVMSTHREYEGIRVRFQAKLESTRIPLQIDLGFGDAVTPEPQAINYPTLLDLPAPSLRGYPVETVIAEKLHTMVEKELLNSRVKDYHDVWMLFRWGQFNRQILGQALARTFERRRTRLDLTQILGIIRQYGETADRQLLWERYHRKGTLESVPRSLAAICDGIADMLNTL